MVLEKKLHIYQSLLEESLEKCSKIHCRKKMPFKTAKLSC